MFSSRAFRLWLLFIFLYHHPRYFFVSDILLFNVLEHSRTFYYVFLCVLYKCFIQALSLPAFPHTLILTNSNTISYTILSECVIIVRCLRGLTRWGGQPPNIYNISYRSYFIIYLQYIYTYVVPPNSCKNSTNLLVSFPLLIYND